MGRKYKCTRDITAYKGDPDGPNPTVFEWEEDTRASYVTITGLKYAPGYVSWTWGILELHPTVPDQDSKEFLVRVKKWIDSNGRRCLHEKYDNDDEASRVAYSLRCNPPFQSRKSDLYDPMYDPPNRNRG